MNEIAVLIIGITLTAAVLLQLRQARLDAERESVRRVIPAGIFAAVVSLGAAAYSLFAWLDGPRDGLGFREALGFTGKAFLAGIALCAQAYLNWLMLGFAASGVAYSLILYGEIWHVAVVGDILRWLLASLPSWVEIVYGTLAIALALLGCARDGGLTWVRETLAE